MVTAGAVAVLSASTALAGTITLYPTPYGNHTGVGAGAGGGEFLAVTSDPFINNYDAKATYTDGKGNTGFETFCMEHNENIPFGAASTYVLNDGAIMGGAGGGISPIVAGKDLLSVGTAWLYSQFAMGVLTGYDYTYLPVGGRYTSGTLLQEAIWYLEGEVTTLVGGSNPFVTDVIAKYGTLVAAAADAGALNYGVAVLNLYGPRGEPLQDQLVFVPEASTMIAGALLLLPLGASALRIVRKNRTA